MKKFVDFFKKTFCSLSAFGWIFLFILVYCESYTQSSLKYYSVLGFHKTLIFESFVCTFFTVVSLFILGYFIHSEKIIDDVSLFSTRNGFIKLLILISIISFIFMIIFGGYL